MGSAAARVEFDLAKQMVEIVPIDVECLSQVSQRLVDVLAAKSAASVRWDIAC